MKNKCQCCGKTENVCLIETQKGTFTIRKYLCEECNKLKIAYESGQISFHSYWVETQNIISNFR